MLRATNTHLDLRSTRMASIGLGAIDRSIRWRLVNDLEVVVIAGLKQVEEVEQVEYDWCFTWTWFVPQSESDL